MVGRDAKKRGDMYAVEFVDLSACLEFLYLLVHNSAALCIGRSDFDSIRVSRSGGKETLTILVRGIDQDALGLLQSLAKVARIETQEKDAQSGSCLTINGLLQQIPPIPRAQPPGENGIAVALFEAEDRSYREWYMQLLDMGCTDIRVGYIQPDESNGKLSHLFLVNHVPDGFFPPSDWNGELGSGTVRSRVFYRLRPADSCRFYIEWGYGCPFEDMDRLYDLSVMRCHLMLICADSPAPTRAGKRAARTRERQPRWLCVNEPHIKHMFKGGETFLRVAGMQAASMVPLTAREPSEEPPTLDLGVRRTHQGMAAKVELLDSQIAWHERAIDELTRDRKAAQRVRQENVYLAFAFRQILTNSDPAGLAPALAPGFRQLLEQPYSRLRHLLYGFYEDPLSQGTDRCGLHIVIDERPSAHGQLLTQLADDVFVQRSDWHKWDLPLFVRYGDELTPRLDDEALAPLVRKLIWKDRSKEDPVLIRTLPQAGSSDEQPSWQALYVTDAKPLTESEFFQFFNDRFSAHVLEFRKEIPHDIETELGREAIQVTQHTRELQQQIASTVASGIREAETYWRQVDQEIRQIEDEAKKLSNGVADIEKAIESSLAVWSQLLRDFIASNEALTRSGAASYAQYMASHSALMANVDDYAKGLIEVEKTLESDRAKLEERQKQLADLDAGCQQAETQLQDSMCAVSAEQDKVQQKILQVNTKVTQAVSDTRSELEATRGRVSALDVRIRTLEEQRRELQHQQQILETREQAANKLTAENDSRREENRKKQAELDAKDVEIKQTRAAVAHQREELAERRTAILRDEAECAQSLLQVRRQKAEVAGKATRLRRNQAALRKEQKALATREAKQDRLTKENDRLCDENESLRKTLQDGEHRITTIQTMLVEESRKLNEQGDRLHLQWTQEREVFRQIRRQMRASIAKLPGRGSILSRLRGRTSRGT